MKKIVFSALLFFLSCSAGPDSVNTSAWSVKHETEGAAAKNYLIGECTIYNSSSSTVYTDYSAEMTIKGSKEKSLLLKAPVAIERIMPYNYGSFSVRIVLNEKDLNALLLETNSDKSKFLEEGLLDAVFLAQDAVSLGKIKFTKTDINNLLKGK
jgi:hypothetical protein